MSITAESFRDRVITHLSVGYDWSESKSFATVTVREANGSTSSYRIGGLIEFSIHEDFGCMAITQCKLLKTSEGVYLSLDPFNELATIEERDNFYFLGKSIERVSSIC